MKPESNIAIFVLLSTGGRNEELLGWEQKLSVQERVQWESMRTAKRRREFLLGRIILRYGLHQYFGDSSSDWVIKRMPSGLLCLDDMSTNPRAAALPSISISHSMGVVGCAMARLPLLGLDIESYSRRVRAIDDIAALMFHPVESDTMVSHHGAAKADYFYRQWTLKEALAKSLGHGLAMPLAQFAFVNDVCTAKPPTWEGEHKHWGHTYRLLAPHVAMALAWATPTADDIVSVDIRLVTFDELGHRI